MLPSTPPAPPAARSPFGPAETAAGFRGWSRQVDDRAALQGWPSLDAANPLLKVAAAVFFGYALGAIVHRHAERHAPPAPPRPRPRRRTGAEPVGAFRSPRPATSSIRFR